ncbi:UNVERIFIED_CONTAM: hypothetical protein K2H54_071064 [Gekko kuhli]
MNTPLLEFNILMASKMNFGRIIPKQCTYWVLNEEDELHKHPTTPEVNGPTNNAADMGSHIGALLKLANHPLGEMNLGKPNSQWCSYWAPLAESEDKETPEVDINGPANRKNTMLPVWGSHCAMQVKLSSHLIDEMDLGVPNPLWGIYQTPVEEFEDEETPEEQENEEALNESMDVENAMPDSQIISLMRTLSRLLAIYTSVTLLK